MSLPILPTISTSCIVISAILVAIGWWQIAHRHVNTHKKVMLWAAFFALTFFIIYATRTIFIGNTDFGGPDSVRTYYKIKLLLHLKINLNGIEESDLSLQLYGSLLVLQVWQYTYYYM